MPRSSRNEHEFSLPRQKQIVLDAQKGSRKGHFKRTFQAKWKETYAWVCYNAEQDKAFCSVCKATRREKHKQRFYHITDNVTL